MEFESDIAEETNEAEAVDVAEISGDSDGSVDGPSVDALEDRLRDLQGAMDKIQSGDLDAAEQAIEELEQQMETTRD